MKLIPMIAVTFALLAFSDALAQGTAFTYQGRVQVGGTNFTGAGQFKFALVSAGTNVTRQATAVAAVNSGFITSYTVTDGGAGYSSPPAVTITDSTGSGATATANVSGGMVTSLTPGSAGMNYSASPTVAIGPPPPAFVFGTYWSHDGTSTSGSEPATAVNAAVNEGLFTIVLGDINVPNMQAIPASAFDHPVVQLRIWFNDGAHGFSQLTPDQPLTATPYAVRAGSVAAGNITGTIGLGQLPLAVVTNGAPALGIGFPTPQVGLNVDGHFFARSLDFMTLAVAEIQDQVQNTGNLSSFDISDIWQSFTAGYTAPLRKIGVDVTHVFPGTNTLKIYSGEGAAGPLLHQQQVTLSASTFNEFTLSTPVSLVAGSKYTFRFTFTGELGPEPPPGFRYSSTDAYPRGTSSLGTNDLRFTTIVGSAPSSIILADGQIQLRGQVNALGTMNAAQFVGGGSGLTGLNAANLASGTLSDARLSSNVPLLSGGKLNDSVLSANVALRSGGNTFAGNQNFTGGGAIITLDNTVDIYAKNSSGEVEGLLTGRWSDNATYFTYGSGGLFIRNNVSVPMMFVSSSGNVGIGTTAPDALLTVNGSASKPGGGSWSSFSDQRLKKNIRPLAGALDKLLALHGVNFEYIDPAKIHELSGERMGLLAQEVEKVFPDWVESGADGYKRVTVRGLEALVVEALRQLRQEQQSTDKENDAAIQELNQKLEEQLKARDAHIEALQERLERLEKTLSAVTASQGQRN